MEWRNTSPSSSASLRLVAAEKAPSFRLPDITPEAPQTLDQPEEADVWLMEEGDDSVFYSDEDQTNQDGNSNTSCDCGAKKSRCPVNSVAHKELMLQRKESQDPGAEAILDKENIEMQNKVSLQFVSAEQNLQAAKTETVYASEQSRVNISSDTAHLLIKVEEEEKFQEQMPRAEPLTSDNRHLDRDQEAEQDYDVRVPVGCHHDRSPGRATLPLPKRSGQSAADHNSFDHLSSSKYSTVSYRRIRRGNTRQKIEEFECMIINM